MIAQFWSGVFTYPTEVRIYGNGSVMGAADLSTIRNVMGTWRPLRITAEHGQIVFQYGSYAPVATGVLDSSAVWQRAKTLRIAHWAGGGGAPHYRPCYMRNFLFSVTH